MTGTTAAAAGKAAALATAAAVVRAAVAAAWVTAEAAAAAVKVALAAETAPLMAAPAVALQGLTVASPALALAGTAVALGEVTKQPVVEVKAAVGLKIACEVLAEIAFGAIAVTALRVLQPALEGPAVIWGKATAGADPKFACAAWAAAAPVATAE